MHNKNFNISETTFGDFENAKILAKILNELQNEKQLKSVSRFLVAQGRFANEIKKVEDKTVLGTILRMWKKEIQNTVLVDIDKKVLTFTKNVAITKVRILERELLQ